MRLLPCDKDTHKRALSILLGTVFVLSGMTKSVNVIAFSKTVGLFLNQLGFSWAYGFKTIIAVLVCWGELTVGLVSLRSREYKILGCLFLVVVLFFTVITLCNLILPEGRIESCGCFGELIHLSARGTFVKNVVLLSLCIIFAVISRKDSINTRMETIHRDRLLITALLSGIIPLTSLLLLDRLPHAVFLAVYLVLCSSAMVFAVAQK